MKNFKESEFLMDGVPVFDKMNPAFLQKLDDLRTDFGHPMKITSSYRSKEKNATVGGASKSMHLIGRAVDVVVTNSRLRARLVSLALSRGLSVGIMEFAVHIDDRPEPVLFHYYASKKTASKEVDE